MPPDDTTVIRIFESLTSIKTDVGVIKAAMPHLATHDQVDLKIAAFANGRKSLPPAKLNGRFTVVVVGAIGALTATVIALTQLLPQLLR